MKPLSSLINAVISRLDEEAWRFLKPHENKIVCFDIANIATLYFQIKPEGLEIIEVSPDTFVDITFKGSLSSFVAMVFSKKVSHPDLHVRGDLECAKALYDTWHYLECDWEGALAELTHPTLATGLFKGLRRGREWLKQTAKHRAHDLTAYLQDESQLLPSPKEIEEYFRNVEELRDDVERLEAKLREIYQKINPPSLY